MPIQPITTQELIISATESTIKSICHKLAYWNYINHKSNKIVHIGHRIMIMRITRDLLNILFGCKIKEYLDCNCKENVKWKLLQMISPQTRRDIFTFTPQARYG